MATSLVRVRTECFANKACDPLSSGSGRTRTCAPAFAGTDLQSASFAARMHAPRSGSGDSSPFPCEKPPEMKKAAEVSQGGFAGTYRVVRA